MGKVYDDWERLVEAVVRREKLRQLCYAHSMSSSDSSSLLDHDSLDLQPKMTMVRLQEELIYSLAQNTQCFEHGYMSLPCCPVYEESSLLVDASPKERSNSDTDRELVLDLLDPEMVPQVKSIADIMFASNCDEEFCEAFVRFGRGAFGVYLTLVNVEELSCEDVRLMEWNSLSSKIRKWRFALKKYLVLYLAKGKQLFDQVLGEYGHVSSRCLIEASKPSLMWFLDLGRFVGVGPDKPEWLFCLLDMHEALLSLIPCVEALFPNDIDSCIRVEIHNLLRRLEDCAMVILIKLGDAFRPVSSGPFPDGGVHPLTKNVLNYVLHFAKFDCILNLILTEKANISISGAVAAHLHSITSALEANIANMSDLYKDTSLKHLFVMNNIHYMVAKINNSKIKTYFGDEWITRHVMKFRFHALTYQRSTWNSILHLLRCDEDFRTMKATLKGRCRDFVVGFENVYKNQRRWSVPNQQLRQELRLSASITVFTAYRTFVCRMSNIEVQHMKYTAHELETLIMDLFQGSS
ncbi:hypothetical protein C2S53_009097 [Perilla frutescens var. hirtella]|uniref:Exocyst subunit Exo70 family protein n=1 Tax=Perilla frutescens var. hirtella TaxID=608512 RepID=A0AAD4INC3_PERFH|nr:hypothetical protein C2S53_009097 [Perilla frutescens var. hirtella]